MPTKLWGRGILLALMLNALFGCGYHVTNVHPARIQNHQNIWVPFFSNESISPTAQTVLKRAFYDELHALRGLSPAVTEDMADLSLKAKIISFSSRVVSYNALDQARELSLVLSVELEVSEKGQKVPFWKGQLQGSKQYPVNANLSLQRNSEDQALDGAARIIAHKFISAIEESY